MPALQRLQFSITIQAPVPTVWRLMLGAESYPRWTSAFAEGCRFEGSWEQGAKILFLASPGDGMVAEIAENRLHEFLSIRHLGSFSKGVEDRASEAVRAWAPAYENYRFSPVPEGTQLLIELDVPGEWAPFMNEAWPKALAQPQQLCQAEAAA